MGNDYNSDSNTSNLQRTESDDYSDSDDESLTCHWKTAVDPASGRTYYYHAKTRETQWRKPVELANHEEKEAMEEKEQKQKDFFAAMEANILASIMKGNMVPEREKEEPKSVVVEMPKELGRSEPQEQQHNKAQQLPKRDRSSRGVRRNSSRPNLIRTISTMDAHVLQELVKRVPSSRNIFQRGPSMRSIGRSSNDGALGKVIGVSQKQASLGLGGSTHSLSTDGEGVKQTGGRAPRSDSHLRGSLGIEDLLPKGSTRTDGSFSLGLDSAGGFESFDNGSFSGDESGMGPETFSSAASLEDPKDTQADEDVGSIGEMTHPSVTSGTLFPVREEPSSKSRLSLVQDSDLESHDDCGSSFAFGESSTFLSMNSPDLRTATFSLLTKLPQDKPQDTRVGYGAHATRFSDAGFAALFDESISHFDLPEEQTRELQELAQLADQIALVEEEGSNSDSDAEESDRVISEEGEVTSFHSSTDCLDAVESSDSVPTESLEPVALIRNVSGGKKKTFGSRVQKEVRVEDNATGQSRRHSFNTIKTSELSFASNFAEEGNFNVGNESKIKESEPVVREHTVDESTNSKGTTNAGVRLQSIDRHRIRPPANTILSRPAPDKQSEQGASKSKVRSKRPDLIRRNTCGTLYVGTTMAAPDKDATIRCVCGVFRVHILQSELEEQGMDSYQFRVFNDLESQQGIPRENEMTRSNRIPPPSLDEITNFYRNVFQRSQMEADCIIISIIYVERLIKTTKGALKPRSSNWRSILFSCMVLSSKVWDDMSMWNVDFSQACPRGVRFSLQRINELEVALLSALAYKVKVPASEYAKYYFLLRSMLIKSGLGSERLDSANPLDVEGAKRLQQLSSQYQHGMGANKPLVSPSKSMGRNGKNLSSMRRSVNQVVSRPKVSLEHFVQL